MRHPKRLAIRVDELAFKRLPGREGDRMQQQMQFAEFLARFGKDTLDLIVFGDVARQEQSVRSKGPCQFLDIFLEAFALVGKGKFRAGPVPRLRDGPCNRAFVCHPKNDSQFAFKSRCHRSLDRRA